MPDRIILVCDSCHREWAVDACPDPARHASVYDRSHSCTTDTTCQTPRCSGELRRL